MEGLFAQRCLCLIHISEHRAVYLLELGNRMLRQNYVGKSEGSVQRTHETVSVMCYRYAHGGTRVYGLYDHRISQIGLYPGYEPVYSEQQIQQVAEEVQVPYVSGGGSEGFTWPLPCSTRVTSRFGTRSDPFTGESRYHSGIDIDGYGNDGAPVVAAASGEVITASYDGSYGNYVIIDHGGTSTVYAHMSGLAVSVGQSVSQGQTIGYVGATGRATGTHLHFEVYVGDDRVDPAQYFSGISYYNC